MENQILQRMCRGRGLVIDRINPREDLLLPPSCSPEHLVLYKNLLDHYAVRLILREVIKSESVTQWQRNRKSLERFCDPEALDSFLSSLEGLGVIKDIQGRNPSSWTFVRSFGPTYEWYVSRVISADLGCPAAWGVRFAEMLSGGDHDVIASVSGRFLYLEAKTAPPKHIEQPEISGFVRRLFDIAPDIAIFHNDTHLRMKDKIVPMLEEGIEQFRVHPPSPRLRRTGSPESRERSLPLKANHSRLIGKQGRFSRLEREIFQLDSCIYVINSKPDLRRNLVVVLRHHFRAENAVLRALEGRGGQGKDRPKNT